MTLAARNSVTEATASEPSAQSPTAQNSDVELAKAAPAPRVVELDILRGVAILLVVFFHSPSEHGASGVLRPLDLLMHRIGWSGVDLFFVLSGYLIGGLLFSELKRNHRLDAARFLVRRMLRIWPAYYALLFFVLARTTYESGGDFGSAWSASWPAFFHIQNFLHGSRDQLWSLAVEEHFYLALPLFLWLATRNKSEIKSLPIIPITSAILCVVCLVGRIVITLTTDIDARLRTDLSFDALFFGVNLAYLKAYNPAILHKVAAKRRLIFCTAWVLFLPAAFAPGFVRSTVGYTGAYLGYALILVCFIFGNKTDWVGRWSTSRSARWVAVIGASSYSIYLWHRDTSWWAYEGALALGHKLGLPTELTWLFHTLAYAAACIIPGMLLGHLIETPVLRLRERFFPSRTTTVKLTA